MSGYYDKIQAWMEENQLQCYPRQRKVVNDTIARNNEPDPLDEILEEAGIPQDAPQRILTRRDGHNVVTSGHDIGMHFLSLTPGSHGRVERGRAATAVIIDDPIKTDREAWVGAFKEEFETNQFTIHYEP